MSARYGVPSAVIKAILHLEMERIDIMDPLADLAVRTGLFAKQDSSTGYAQIFGYVGVEAINFAVDRRLTTYEQLGISCNHRLDPGNIKDVRLVWKKLNSDPKANIEIAALNLLAAADEVTGRIDFGSFSDDELKRVLTRYNAAVSHVTSYGEQAFLLYKSYLGKGD